MAGSNYVAYNILQIRSDGEKAQARNNIGAAAASDVTALQSQVSSLSDVSAYSVKGEATVSQLNAGPSGIQAGWVYQLTDSGTLTNGSLAVVAGDTVAWDGTKWFPLVTSDYYATKAYVQEEVGVQGSSVNGTALSAGTHKYIVYPSGALSGNTDLYRYLELPVQTGQVVKVTGRTKSLAASIFAVYNKDNSLSQIYMQSAINVTETFTHTISGNESYIRISSHIDVLSYFNAVLKSTGIKADIDNLAVDVGNLQDEAEQTGDDVGVLKVKTHKLYEVGTFYSDSWTRYDDGRIFSSSSGSKQYIIKRTDIPENATKIIADVCPEYDSICAIAFFSSDTPSQATYMKSSSVPGVNSHATNRYEATLPQSWGCALVLNMSQYQDSYSIELDVPVFPKKNEVDSVARKYSDQSKSLFNIFAKKPYVHHFDPDTAAANQSVPSQSLIDVAYAAELGADFIEANTHECSDGVIVCKHGASGKLGRGLKTVDGSYTPEELEAMAFSDVTSTWLREKVVYDCVGGRFATFIPTFDEFCRECKKFNIGVLFYGVELLPIARKYLTDDKMNVIDSKRDGGFKGTLEYFWNPSSETIDAAVEKCLGFGVPCVVEVSPGVNIYNFDLQNACKKAHEKGLLVGINYGKTNDNLYALKCGVDSIASSYRNINNFDFGDLFNISSLNDSRLVLSGASYDSENGKITMNQNGTVYAAFDSLRPFAKVCVTIRFSGTLTFVSGVNSDYYNVKEIESDGSEIIKYAVAIAPTSSIEAFSRALTITANESSEIYMLKISAASTL